MYLDMDALQNVIEAKIAAKVVDQIEGVIGTYDLDELLAAADLNIEIEALEAAKSGLEH